MKQSEKNFLELAALAATAAYVFWRWVDHASYGGPTRFAIVFHSVIVGVLSIPIAFACRRPVSQSPVRTIAAAVALVVCVCYIVSLGDDLARFRAIGGPGSKEMRELLRHQHIIALEAQDVFLQAAALRIERECGFTSLIALLLWAYLSRLREAVTRVGEA